MPHVCTNRRVTSGRASGVNLCQTKHADQSAGVTTWEIKEQPELPSSF